MRALLVGNKPPCFDYTYVQEAPYEAVVIGSLTIGQLLRFSHEQVLGALAEGKQVILYEPGLPRCPGNRALSASLAAGCRELKNWGVVFTDGAQRRVITAQQAQKMREQGITPGPGAVLTPLAKEIFDL